MAQGIAALRAEHRALLPSIDRLRAIGDDVGRVSGAVLRRELAEAHAFLENELIPHARAEDEVLYPEVARLLGGPRATATMSRDHVAVMDLVAELSALRTFDGDPDDRRQGDLRAVLYGLHALVRTHFAKEEEIYVPLLDERLTVADAGDLIERMERAASRVKSGLR